MVGQIIKFCHNKNMIRKIIFLFLLIFFLFILNNQVLAQQENVDVFLFYGQGCPHCAQAEKFLKTLKKNYPNLTIKEFEVYFNQENRSIYFALANAYKINVTEVPVPAIFIGEKYFIGYSSYVGSQIKREIIKCSSQKCPSPIEKLSSDTNPNTNPNIPNNPTQIIIGWIVIGLIVLVAGFLIIKLVFRKK